MFKFIFDETGAKTINDKENKIGLVVGFFLTDRETEKYLIQEIELIIQEYSLKSLPKLHVSAISDHSIKEKIEEKVFMLLNKLNIVWTYGSTHIKKYKEKNSYRLEENVTEKIKKDRKRSDANWPIPSFYEECLLKAFINVIDFQKYYYKNEKEIEIISDPIDNSLIKSFNYLIEKTINPKKEFIGYGYDKEKKEKTIDFIIKGTLNVPLPKVPTYEFKCENSNLTFIADVLAYRTFKILKENIISENKLNNFEIMNGHPCEYLFIFSKEIDEYFDFL